MPRGIEGNEIASRKPAASQRTMPPQTSASKGQKSLLGFFAKKLGPAPVPSSSNELPLSSPTPAPKVPTLQKATTARSSSGGLTPAPSSDGPERPSPEPLMRPRLQSIGNNKENGLPSPITPTSRGLADGFVSKEIRGELLSSPSRRVSVQILQ